MRVYIVSLKDVELNDERQELAVSKNHHQMALQDAEEELDTQRRELSAGNFLLVTVCW